MVLPKMKAISILCVIFFLISSFAVYSTGGVEEVAAEERPVWIWGIPAGYGGTFTEESLVEANEWALEKFGATFKISSQPSGVTGLEGLNVLLAEGKFPDVIVVGSTSDVKVAKMLVDMAKFGKTMAVDKYYNDSQGYPNLYKTGRLKDQMSAFMWQGKLYSFPGTGTRLDADDPAYNGVTWCIRWDALKALNAEKPTNLDELYSFLKKAVNLGLKDLAGEPSFGFGMTHWSNLPDEWTRIIYTMKGAGWEVDGEKRLMPKWASEETHEALKYVNLLYREGLLHPNFDIVDEAKNIDHRKRGTPIVHAGMENWDDGINTNAKTRPTLLEKYGSEEAAMKDPLWDVYYVNMIPPIQEPDGKLGAFVNNLPQSVVMSAENPNPDATMKLVDWLLTDEAIITLRTDQGRLGYEWEWADPPLNWKRMDSEGQTVYYESNKSYYAGWRGWSEINADAAKENPPKVLPGLQYLCIPPITSWAERLWGFRFDANRGLGYPVDGRVGTETVTNLDYEANQQVQKEVVSPRPSYMHVMYDLGTMEVSALARADQRFDESLAKVLTADTPEQFEIGYRELLNTMMQITNWKPIYEKKQANWLDWIKSNKIDDRATLRTVTPRSEWKEVMGW